jgi:hypothetical protein
MPKKSPARQASTQHRPQTKRKDVLLVRASSSTDVVEVSEEEEVAEQKTTETIKAGATKAKPTSTLVKTAQPTTTAGKRPGVPTKPGAQPTRALAAQRSGRPGQKTKVRPAQRLTVGRQANLVSAEHYRYVLKDLRLIAILAAFMFSVLIALAFILPNVLKY